jgi:hypothetical protein
MKFGLRGRLGMTPMARRAGLIGRAAIAVTARLANSWSDHGLQPPCSGILNIEARE